MIKEAIETIVDLSAPLVTEVDGEKFLLSKDGNSAVELHAEPRFPKILQLHSLEALVNMIRTEAVGYHKSRIYVNVGDSF